MSIWIEKTLGDFITLQRGYDLPESERREGKVPVVGSFGITGYHDIPKATGPGVTVGRSGASFGTVFYCPVDFWPHNAALYVKNFHGNDEKFVYYFLKSFDFTSYNSGSAQPSLNRNYIYPIPIVVPQLDEQRAIADILGSLDDKIEANRRQNEILEATARAIFKSWFVDFDPVHAKANGEIPIGMDAETADLFPDSFEDSELGMIPSGWRVGTLGEILDLDRNSVKPQSHPNELFYHYSIPAFNNGAMPVMEKGEMIKSNKYAIPENCILISKLNPRFKKIWLPILKDDYQSICSTEFLVCIPKKGVSKEFLFGVLNDDIFYSRYEQLVTGTSSSHQRVKPNSFIQMPIIIPNIECLAKFTDLMHSMLASVSSNRSESETLAETRDALLPKLVSGELRAGEL